MKKLYVFLLLFLLILPVAALAEGEIPTQPFSWEQLGTIAGAALATMLIVQLSGITGNGLPGLKPERRAIHTGWILWKERKENEYV